MLDQAQISALKVIYFMKAQFERREERGATAVEYGLMVALIACAIVLTVTAIGTQLNTTFGKVKDAITVAS